MILSRGGCLILINLFLDIIPIYWTSIVSMPKGILSKIKKIIFHFLWKYSRHFGGIPLVKWSRVASSKNLGRWGIKKKTYSHSPLQPEAFGGLP
jgi:hypothetical protein